MAEGDPEGTAHRPTHERAKNSAEKLAGPAHVQVINGRPPN
jgi:hypothetical protein